MKSLHAVWPCLRPASANIPKRTLPWLGTGEADIKKLNTINNIFLMQVRSLA
jgi:hypothetical protein